MQNTLEQVTRYAFSFTGLNTVLYDPSGKTLFNLGSTTIPPILEPYFENQTMDLFHQVTANKQDLTVQCFCNNYRQNFITVKFKTKSTVIALLVLGPYLFEPPTLLMIESILVENRMTLSHKNLIAEYYNPLPLYGHTRTNEICEFLIYLTKTFNKIKGEILYNEPFQYNFRSEPAIPFDQFITHTGTTITQLEKRYQIENAMLNCIEKGDYEGYKIMLKTNSANLELSEARRPSMSLNSGKSYCIILNTLLRKAAEKGGLHPVYLDSISNKFNTEIEMAKTFKQLNVISEAMPKNYCETLNKFSLIKYSKTIQRAIEYIRLNLNSPLSLEEIAQKSLISSFELSRRFKSEVGENLIDYINRNRINESLYLLGLPNLSITEIAHMIGYNDANHFTKTFKKWKKMTPSDYKKSKNGNGV